MSRLIALLLCLFSMAATAAADVLDGLWEIGLVMRVEGQDYGPYTRQQCLTKADAQEPSKLFAEASGGCEYANKRYFGNQFNFNVRCNVGIPLTGTGQVEFSAERMSGSMNLSAQVPDGPSVEMASAISGKRLGPCQK